MSSLTRMIAMTCAAVLSFSIAAGAVTLKRGNGPEPDSLDPHKASTAWENNIIGDMIMGLTTEDIEAHPIPGAAESWTTSEDGLVWTFKLRADGKWSDGIPGRSYMSPSSFGPAVIWYSAASAFTCSSE